MLIHNILPIKKIIKIVFFLQPAQCTTPLIAKSGWLEQNLFLCFIHIFFITFCTTSGQFDIFSQVTEFLIIVKYIRLLIYGTTALLLYELGVYLSSLVLAYLPLLCLNNARISSKVLFLVSGTFLYVKIQKMARNALNGRNVQFSRALYEQIKQISKTRYKHFINTYNLIITNKNQLPFENSTIQK